MEKLSALFDRLAVLLPEIVDKSVEYDFDLAVFSDVLMLLVSAVLSQQGEAIDVFLEMLSLLF